jgi:hypothetical protein
MTKNRKRSTSQYDRANKYIYTPSSLSNLLKYSDNKKLTLNMDLNRKFIITLLIINSLVLIVLLFVNFYISLELSVNLDDYVSIHKFVYKKN